MDEEEPIDEEGEGTTDGKLVSTDKGQTGEGQTDKELTGEEIPRDEVPTDRILTGAEMTLCNFKWTFIPPRFILGANSFPVIALTIRFDLYNTFPVLIASANSLQPSWRCP